MGGERVTQPMWWPALMGVMLILGSTCSTTRGGLCPGKCQCNDDSLSAVCSSALLEVVPIQLNPELRHIDLSDNKISNLNYILSIYANLLTLDLSANKIHSLGANNFQQQRSLHFLNISRNEIEKLHKDSLNGLKALTKLDLSFNRLEKLHNSTFLQMHSLQILILTGNRLAHLEPGLFRTVKQLKEILLDDNQLLEFPSQALTDTLMLQNLVLSRNLINIIKEGDVPALPELRHLAIDGNIINSIRQTALSGVTSLDRLDLSDNNFTSIPSAPLAKLSNLTRLKLNGNFIQNIPPVAFRGLFQLRFLHLDRLEILQKIDPRAFVDNIKLEKIWLNDNIAMQSIPTKLFHGNPNINSVSIKNNALIHVEPANFPLDQLRKLELGGNPLECNCSLLWLWKLGQNVKDNVTNEHNLHIDAANIICHGPEPLKNLALANITEAQMNCSVGWITIISSVSSAVFLVVVLLGALLYKPIKKMYYKRKAQSKRPQHDLCEPYPYETHQVTEKYIPPPALHQDYRSIPTWEPYEPYANDYLSAMNIYEQLEHAKDRPHIVYV